MEGLKEKIFSYHPNGVTYDGTNISSLNYLKNCDFQIKEVMFYTQDKRGVSSEKKEKISQC